jgi:hypothetical protein
MSTIRWKVFQNDATSFQTLGSKHADAKSLQYGQFGSLPHCALVSWLQHAPTSAYTSNPSTSTRQST